MARDELFGNVGRERFSTFSRWLRRRQRASVGYLMDIDGVETRDGVVTAIVEHRTGGRTDVGLGTLRAARRLAARLGVACVIGRTRTACNTAQWLWLRYAADGEPLLLFAVDGNRWPSGRAVGGDDATLRALARSCRVGTVPYARVSCNAFGGVEDPRSASVVFGLGEINEKRC